MNTESRTGLARKTRGILRLGLPLLMLAGGCRGAGGSGTADPAVVAMVDSLLPEVQRVSLLAETSPVRVAERTPAQVREFVQRKLDEEMPAAELDGMRRAYVRLGLLAPDLDLRQLLLDLYSEQIAGYYDPHEKTLFVLRGASAASLRPVVAHELVHALQDQHANIDSLISRRRGNDHQAAAQAALEGHATLVMFTILAEDAAGGPVDPVSLPDPASQLRPAFEDPSGQFPVFRNAPRVIRETLVFPYAAGASFVQQLWRAAGPLANRRAPLGDFLPQSTEQVLHPIQRFVPVRDAPTELRLDGFGDWSPAYSNTLGALEIGILLEEHLGRLEAPAWGWDGDRYTLLERPDGAEAVLWISVWDDSASADTFAARIRDLLADDSSDRAGVVERFTLEGRPAVRVRITGGSVPPDDVPPGEATCVNEAGEPLSCSAR